MVDFKIKDILATAEGVKNNVEIYGEIPDTANVNGTNYLISQFADVMIVTTLQLDPRQGVINNNNVKNRPVNLPSTSIESLEKGKVYLDDYMDLADRIYGFNNKNMKLPTYADCPLGQMSWQNIIYMFSRILAWYKNNNNMPSYANVEPWTRKPPVGNSSSLSGSTIPDELKQYLQVTANCQVNDSSIQSLAKQLNTAKDVFYYVRDKLGYDFYENTTRGAVKTLKDKIGNCCDLSHLCVALCRAKGIPARYKHVYDQFTSITCGHVVAQCYINGNWYDMDASNNGNAWNEIGGKVLKTYGYYKELPF